jgi:hypothetical protein
VAHVNLPRFKEADNPSGIRADQARVSRHAPPPVDRGMACGPVGIGPADVGLGAGAEAGAGSLLGGPDGDSGTTGSVPDGAGSHVKP